MKLKNQIHMTINTTRFKYDFLDIHNDDLVEVSSYEGISTYVIDYEKAEKRRAEFIQKMIDQRKKNESKTIHTGLDSES